MINEVVEFSQAALDPGLFEVPQGFREVSDPSQMYAAAGVGRDDEPFASGTPSTENRSNGKLASTVSSAAKSAQPATGLGPKKAGVVRVGIAGVKIGSVGEGVAASDLAAAIQNTFAQHLKVPNVEVVVIDAKVAAAIDSEAHSKECDFVAFLIASHKKGGGGFGMFKSLAPVIGSVIPSGAGTAGTGGYIAGTVASHAVITTATVAEQVKNKDEITLDVKVNRTGSTPVVEKSFKAKAKSNGEDIVAQVVQQAAQAVVATIGK